MPKSFPKDQTDTIRWAPPRGFPYGGEWEFVLGERVASSSADGAGELRAAKNYAALIDGFANRMGELGWSQRELARRAGVAQAVVSKTFSGSVWPRWTTLTALGAALGLRLELDGYPGADPIAAILKLIDGEPEFTGISVARDVGIRPNTLGDLRKPGREPVSATVFALAAWSDLTVEVVEE